MKGNKFMTQTEKNLSDLFFDFDFPFTDWETYRSDFEAYSRRVTAVDKSLLEGAPYEIDVENQDPVIENGCFYSDINGAHIEGFFHKGTENKLIVMFDGSRTRNGGKELAPLPTFLRRSWHNLTNASFISIEDPMYYLHDTLKLGWFYGTKTVDFRNSVAALVLKIAKQLGVEAENILLYGISGGGTAAIGTARYVKGSTVVAINPGFLPEYIDAKHFESVTGIDLSEKDEFMRNDIPTQIIENKESKFIILTNLASTHDYSVQLFKLCAHMNTKPKYGINKNGNVYNWLFYAVGAPSPHASFENPLLFRAVLFVAQCINDGVELSYISGFCKMVNQIWREQYNFKRQLMNSNKKIKELELKTENRKTLWEKAKNLFLRALRKLKRIFKN